MNIPEIFRMTTCAVIASIATATLISKPSKTLTAQQIILKDDKGKVTMQFDGRTFSIYDENGEEKFGFFSFGKTAIFGIRSGKEVVTLVADPDESMVRIDGKNGYIGLSSKNAIKIK